MLALSKIARIGIAVALCQIVAAGAGGPLWAQDDQADKVTQLNREALGAIDKREFEKAREILKRALDLCHAAGLDRHPIAARTHIHMGVVIIEGFKIRELGIKQFGQALEIAPDITITPSLDTPELDDALAEARAKSAGASGGASSATAGAAPEEATPAPVAAPVGGAAGGPVPAASADERPPREAAASRPAASASGIAYHTVSEVKQGNSIRVTVNLDANLKFHRLILAYRPRGTSEFLGRDMEPAGGDAYSAEIPDRATTGSSVAYYIEAQDDDGQPVAWRGTEDRPLVIQLEGAAAGASSDRSRATLEKKHADRKSEDDDGDEDEMSERWFASLLVGSGFGYTSGTGELNADTAVPGTLSGALLGQISPEVGYWIHPDLLLSGQARIQIVSGPTEIDANGRTYNPEDFALALFAKVTWFFGAGDLRPFLSVAAGGGQIRHVVTFASLKDCGPGRNQTCVDSVVAGPALAEAGGGLMYKLSPNLGLVASVNLQAAAPKFTLNADLNGGVAFNF